MLSSPNRESGRPKLALLVLKDKSKTKTLTKPEKCSHASPCIGIGKGLEGIAPLGGDLGWVKLQFEHDSMSVSLSRNVSRHFLCIFRV